MIANQALFEEDEVREAPAKRRQVLDLEAEERKTHRIRMRDRIGVSGMWPLAAPGMPLPGPNFLRTALAMGCTTVCAKATKKAAAEFIPGPILTELYGRALREPGFTLSVDVRQGFADVSFVPGHIWSQHVIEWQRSIVDPRYEPPPVDGPHPADVFILGKMPWQEETVEKRNLVGATGEILKGLVDELHVKGASKWYVSNVVKFMPPDGDTRLRANWAKDCLPLLHQELRIVRPKYILCLGADATKAILGKRYGVGNMAGRVLPYTFDMRESWEDEEEKSHTAQVMTILHPAEAARDPSKARTLYSNFSRFTFLLKGNDFSLEEKDLDHRACYTLEDAQEWVEEADHYFAGVPEKDRLVGMDLEWQGQHPMNEGAYVRTIQIAWAEKKAICFVMAHPGGKTAFRDRDGKPAVKRLVKLLNAFLLDKRPVGHFFVSDLEWANYLGLDPTAGCPIPLEEKDGKLAWQRLRDGEGWLDTAYMQHAIEETSPLGLEVLAMRYTTCPRYDIPLDEWKKKRRIAGEGIDGYGDCPDKILVPYANYDACVTLRIAKNLLPLLDEDFAHNCCWEPYWESMTIQKPILRMHKNGILVSRKRIDDLTEKFMTARYAQEEKIYAAANWPGVETKDGDRTWPGFNVRSIQHVKEYLFGEALNGRRDENGRIVKIRPPGAKSLRVEPLLDTSKPPRRWSELKQKGADKDASPGTGKQVLGILAQENENVTDEINLIRDYRFLDQVLKSVLRPPLIDANNNWIEDDDGNLVYEKGLAACIDADGRVRTHIYPTAETGRWKHSRPNTANVSKSRDPDYKRLLGEENYKHKIRSIFRASPGFAFIEADIKGAELYFTALLSGSKKMLDHCNRANTYPEAGFDRKGNPSPHGLKCPVNPKKGCKLCGYPHPEYYDIHSNIAKLAFRLDCHPSKYGLDRIEKVHFRVLAKNVIFGLFYGRGAKAIAMQAREQGVQVSPEQAQLVMRTIFAMYPELVPFFDEAKSRALNEKWLCNCFGRYRHFASARDYKLEGEFERQAMNFPIQSATASAVDRGIAWLDHEIDRLGLQDDIRLLLQIHDAVLVEARYELVPYAMQLIKWAMVDMVPIYPTDLAGVPRGDGPYYLGLDFAVESAWSEKISPADYEKLGIV